MKKRSEGVKRITFLGSIVALITCLIFFLIVTEGFNKVQDVEWLFILISMFVSFSIPQIIKRVIYWVKDGFAQDKKI